tara:strand:- start:1109 stop:1858 length:750 start_codon:yes stop_codon:yes gene_type:complete
MIISYLYKECDIQITVIFCKRLWPIFLIAIILTGIIVFDLDGFFEFETLKDNRETLTFLYDQNRYIVIISLFMFYALLVILSVPGAVWLSLIAGFLMGTWAATLLVVPAATFGALGLFLIIRYSLSDYFRQKMGTLGQRMEAGFKKNELSYLLVLRLVPVFPFWLVNLAPALLGVSIRTFVIGTFFGIIPGTAVFCSLGNGLGVYFEQGAKPDLNILFEPEIIGPLLALSVLSLVPIIFKKAKILNIKK